MNIPFIDLKQQYLKLKKNIDESIQNVLEHGQYIMGPEVAKLECNLADFVGIKNVISCSSGTDALLIPLMAYNVGRGDAIFTSTFTFIATAEVITLLGATPVFVDIDPNTFNIDADSLEKKIAEIKKTGELTPRGIIPVDIFGLPANYSKINAVAQKNNLFVLEDAAQSLGATYHQQKAGSFGNVAATSFYPAKPLGCYGDGGAIFTDDDAICNIMRSIRIHGQGENKYDNVRIGINGRMDSIQAAILLQKLHIFPEEIERRNEVAKMYSERLQNYVETPYIPNDLKSSWAQYSILSPQRNRIQSHLQEKGIPTCIFYPKPLHLQEVFAHLGYLQGNFPVAEKTAQQIISLPMHPYLEEKQVEIICNTIIESIEH